MSLPSFNRRFAPALALACALAPASQALAQGTADLPATNLALTARLTAWYETSSLRAPGQWGIAVADHAGRMLWSMNPDQPLMPASTVKLFTTGFARSVLGGTARRPTRVVGIAPGLVNTDFSQYLVDNFGERMAASLPTRRLGEPDDIGALAVFLASDKASWITGETYVVDGGEGVRAVN